MQEKYKRDGTGNRRGYNTIESAQKTGGLVSWVDTNGLDTLHHHGASSGTVVIAESLNPGEREFIKKHLGTTNILSAKEAIGLDYDVVILWNPLSKNKCIRDLTAKTRGAMGL